MTLATWTTQQVLDQLISGYNWSGNTITYAFPTTSAGLYGSDESTGFSALSAAGQASAVLALQLWDDLIAPSFQEVSEGASGSETDLEFGMTTTGPSYAWAYFPTNGSVWFNTGYDSGTNNLVSPGIGDHGFASYIHEIGHALGLEHMGDYNGTGDAATDGSSYQDSTVYSIMSYFGPSWGSGSSNGEGLVAWADWVASDGQRHSPQTPMLNDILAMQTVYGADSTTRTGDTVYGFNCNIGGSLASIYDFTENEHPILTLYDAAGFDTIDLSGFSTSCTIDLAPGAFSSCDAMTYNIAIAYSCDIEAAVGGGMADILLGNTLDNQLTGGGGNDTLDGGDGYDTAIFSGTYASYTITENSDGSYSVVDAAGDDGSDTLTAIEALRFSDLTYLLGHQPVLDAAFEDQSAAEDSLFSWTVPADSFSDVDSDPLTYSATLENGDALPSWLSFDAATRTFSGTPGAGDVGTLSVKVTASDGTGSASDVVDIVVAHVNHAPTVDHEIADRTATETSQFIFSLDYDTFVDSDSGDTLTLTATLANGDPLPSWLTFVPSSRVFYGTPEAGDAGSLSVKVTASDGTALVSTEFDIVIDAAPENHAPEVSNPISAQTATEDLAFSFIVAADVFADADVGDVLTYAATLENGDPLPSWLVFDPSTRGFSGTPGNDDVGTLSIKVTASDAAASVSTTFDIAIANSNDAPQVADPIADQTATEDQAFSFTFDAGVFADVDAGDSLTYAATLEDGSALPAWLSFDTLSRTFSGTPGNDDVGTLSVVVTASDGEDNVSDTFAIVVANVNDAPDVANPLTDRTATQDVAFSFTAPADAFVDIDGGDILTYSATLADGSALPDWLDFDTATLSFTGIPGAGDVGTVSVKLTASDGTATASDTFDIVISGANLAPTLDHAIADQVADEDVAFSFELPADTFSDIDGDTLTYSAALADGSALPDWLNFDPATRTFSGTPDASDTGTLSVAVTVSDGNTTASDTFDISVESDNSAPMALDDFAFVEEGGTTSFDVLANDVDLDDDGLQLTSAVFVSDNGTGTYSADGTFSISYTGPDLDAGETAEIVLDYDVSDGVDTDTATLTITVTGQREKGDDIVGTGGKDRLKGTGVSELIEGLGGNDTLFGKGGGDDLDGGRGNDRLTGGGGGDTFLFSGKHGKDTIADFAGNRGDSIDLDGISAISGFKDLMRHHVFSRGDDLLIKTGGSNQILLLDTDRSDLHSGDFLF